MARHTEPTAAEMEGWAQWAAERPPAVWALCARFNPWTVYRIAGGHRVKLVGFDEPVDGPPTLRVAVTADLNLVAFERQVFDIPPEETVECEMPLLGELLGAAMDHEEARDAMPDIARKLGIKRGPADA